MINSNLSSVNQTAHAHRHHGGGSSENAQNLKALSSSLSSGDLAGAQKAFAALTANAPKNAAAQNSPLGQDVSALRQALQSGDVAGSQKAFATLQQDMQARGGEHSAPPKGQPIKTDPDGDTSNSVGGVNISA
jgi:hypothetical protein